MFDKIKSDLEGELANVLPGVAAQSRMASYSRQMRVESYPTPPADVRVAGVLVMFYPKDEEIFLTLMLRTRRGPHSGQVSFPGGGVEAQDADIVATALREAQEEVGIQPEEVTILGKLTPLYIPVSNSMVHPVVAYSQHVPNYEIEPEEVQHVIEAPLSMLRDSANIKTVDMTVSEGLVLKDTPYFDVNGHVVWGATAMILSELLEVVERVV